MKEAIGGTWIFGLVIFFIAFFTAFISISLNYSKCYKLKDEIISAIQRSSGVNDESLKEINDYMKSIGYRSQGDCNIEGHSVCIYGFNIKTNDSDSFIPNSDKSKSNYCISKISTSNIYGYPNAAYYYVRVFFKFDLPVIREVFSLNVEGETSVIYAPLEIDALSKCA